MSLDEGTQGTVRELWEVGARYGRVPTPTPEMDPWEDPDPAEAAPGHVVVEFPGRPGIVVRLEPDGEDTVRLVDTIDLDVDRRDTVACVESVLAGRVRVRRRRAFTSAWWALVPLWLQTLFPGDILVVPLAGGRTHEQPVPADAPGGGWLATLPEA